MPNRFRFAPIAPVVAGALLSACAVAERAEVAKWSDDELRARVAQLSTGKLCDEVASPNRLRERRVPRFVEDELRRRGEYAGCLQQRRDLAVARTAAQAQSQAAASQALLNLAQPRPTFTCTTIGFTTTCQ